MNFERLHPYFGDRLARFITVKGWSPLKIAVVILLLNAVSIVSQALASSRLLPSPYYLSLSEDYVALTAGFILVPTIWAYYIWSCTAPANVLMQLASNHVLSFNEETLQLASKTADNRLPVLVASIIALVLATAGVFQGKRVEPSWYNTSLLTLIVNAIPNALYFYVTSITVLRFWATIRVFRQMLNDISPQPLHPDGAGGLSALGHYALQMTYPLALGGSYAAYCEYWSLTRGQFDTDISVHLMVIAYIIAAPLLFIAPILSSHRAMVRTRDRLLLIISNQFTQDFNSASVELNKPAITLEESVDKVEQLRKLHTIVKSYPVWPINLDTLRRFFVSYFSPVVTFIFTLIVDNLLFQ